MENATKITKAMVLAAIKENVENMEFAGDVTAADVTAYCAKTLEQLANKSEVKSDVYEGTVTGIINSNKKTGIFVELNGLYITGLMPIDSSELLDFKPGDQIKVKVKEFEVQEGKEPFVLNKSNKVTFANTRCVFELA